MNSIAMPLVGELQAEAYLEEFGWNRVAIVRPANVYGPRDNFDPATAMVIPALIARAVSGENPLVVWGDGSTARDFLFSRDCAVGMLLALERAAGWACARFSCWRRTRRAPPPFGPTRCRTLRRMSS